MSKPSYNIHLKGYVGGADFGRNAVDTMLAANNGKQVNVLIDSLGGSLATGLSIPAAFKQHGNVAVHFVGLNARPDFPQRPNLYRHGLQREHQLDCGRATAWPSAQRNQIFLRQV